MVEISEHQCFQGLSDLGLLYRNRQSCARYPLHALFQPPCAARPHFACRLLCIPSMEFCGRLIRREHMVLAERRTLIDFPQNRPERSSSIFSVILCSFLRCLQETTPEVLSGIMRAKATRFQRLKFHSPAITFFFSKKVNI